MKFESIKFCSAESDIFIGARKWFLKENLKPSWTKKDETEIISLEDFEEENFGDAIENYTQKEKKTFLWIFEHHYIQNGQNV